MQLKTNNDIVVGRFGRVHGIGGLIRVHSFTEDPLAILDYQPWYYPLAEFTPAKAGARGSDKIILLATTLHHDTILVRVQGFETREKASLLTNTNIAVPQSVLPPLPANTFYCFELIGMEVSDVHGQVLGTVTDVFPTGANDVLVIEGKKRVLIPYLLEKVIKKIDRTAKTIMVDWDDAI